MHQAFPARSSPIRLRSACQYRLAHRAGRQSDSRRHRRASRALARSASLLDVWRGGRRGGYVGATLEQKPAPKGRESRSFAASKNSLLIKLGRSEERTRTDCWGTFAKNVENSFTGAVSTVSFWPGRTRKNAGGVGESWEAREASWSLEK